MTMVERVAKAIEDAHDDGAWGCYERIGRAAALECARAAVEAMRKPCRAMIVSGATAINQRKFGCPPDDELDAVRVYERMIEAVLRDAT